MSLVPKVHAKVDATMLLNVKQLAVAREAETWTWRSLKSKYGHGDVEGDRLQLHAKYGGGCNRRCSLTVCHWKYERSLINHV